MKTSKFFLSTLIAAAAMTASAYADAVIETPVKFDFNADSLSGVSENSFTVTDTSGFNLTISTTGSAFGFGAWSTSDPTATDASNLKSITGSNTLFGTDSAVLQDFAMDYITAGGSAANGYDLTITFSGLTAGNAYNIGLLTGLPFEGSGGWNTVTTTNSYKSSTPTVGSESIAVMNTVTGYDLSRVVADAEGNITLKINSGGSHTAALNALAISSAAAKAYWMGQEGADTWSGSGAAFSNDTYGEYAVFGAGSQHLNVTVSGAVTGNQVDINDAYAYSIDSTSSFTVSSVTVEADEVSSSIGFVDGTASASFANDGAVSITKMDVTSGSVAFSGTGTTSITTLNLTGGDATFSGTGTTNITTLNLAGGRKLEISDGRVETNNVLNLYGTMRVTGALAIAGSSRLEIESGGVMSLADGAEISRTGAAIWGQGSLVVEKNAMASFEADNDYHLNYEATGGNITLESGSTLHLNLQSLQTWNNEASVSLGAGSNLNVTTTNGFTLNASSTLNLDGGTFTVASGTATINGAVNVTNGGSFDVESGATLAFDATSRHGMYAADFTLKDGATLKILDAGAISSGSAGDYQFSITGDMTVSGSATLRSNWAKETAFEGLLSGSGTLKYFRDNDPNFNVNGRLIITGDDKDFSGTLHIDSSNDRSIGLDLDASMTNATVKLSGGTSNPAFLGVWKDVAIKRLEGNATTKIGVGYGQISNMTGGNYSLTVGEGEFSGIIQDKIYKRGGNTSTELVSEGKLALVKNTTGTLTLSGSNTYTGGTKIEGGILVAASNSALGKGVVKVNGGQLNVGEGVTLSNASITVVLGDAYNADSGVVAIFGKGALADGTTILLDWATSDADQQALMMVASMTETQYKVLGGSLVGAEGVTFELSKTLKDRGWDGYKYDDKTGFITLVPVPEPSAFGLLAGVGALALVASRRRRNRR